MILETEYGNFRDLERFMFQERLKTIRIIRADYWGARLPSPVLSYAEVRQLAYG